jgi:glutamyl-tRNA reductase
LPDANTNIAESDQPLAANTQQQCGDPVIVRFRAVLTSIQTKELDRLYHRLPELDERSRQEIGQFADCLVATILRPPLESLRDESRNNFSHGLLDALQRLFQLAD